MCAFYIHHSLPWWSVALQPKFHLKQVIDEFVDEANQIRQQNKH